jgi:hypothetical protein
LGRNGHLGELCFQRFAALLRHKESHNSLTGQQCFRMAQVVAGMVQNQVCLEETRRSKLCWLSN